LNTLQYRRAENDNASSIRIVKYSPDVKQYHLPQAKTTVMEYSKALPTAPVAAVYDEKCGLEVTKGCKVVCPASPKYAYRVCS
jgi:hypothetical protein